MNLQYIIDNTGNKTAVLISMNDWNYLKRKFKVPAKEDLEPDKEQILQGIKQAVEEVNLIKKGKLKAKSFDDFINEL